MAEEPKAPKPTAPSPQVIYETRLKPLMEKAIALFNARNAREKVMIVLFTATFVLFVDYWIFLRPAVNVFATVMPKLVSLDGELKALREDDKNRTLIAKNWETAKTRLAEKEGRFIRHNQLPLLLGNLSKLASESGIKITSLKPVDASMGQVRKGSPYIYTPVRMSAAAGTHEIGKFLSHLEADSIFYRVGDMRIVTDAVDIHRHSIEIVIETYLQT